MSPSFLIIVVLCLLNLHIFFSHCQFHLIFSFSIPLLIPFLHDIALLPTIELILPIGLFSLALPISSSQISPYRTLLDSYISHRHNLPRSQSKPDTPTSSASTLFDQ